MLLLSLLFAAQTGDTLQVREIPRPPPPDVRIDTVALGAPRRSDPNRSGNRAGLAGSGWRTPCSSLRAFPIPRQYWGDDFVVSLDTRGDGAPSPQHDDFQLDFRRVLDSSVVYRGRDGRWQPPRGDPDWRLGAERSGGGWEVSGRNEAKGWSVLIRLDPAWLEGEAGRRPRIAFRIYDDAPGGWFAWPAPRNRGPATTVEQSPATWSVVGMSK